MKKATSLLLLCSLVFTAHAQSVGIGTSTPNASAQLDISSTGKGLLIPRMNSAAINAISNPAKGLMVLDTAKNQLVFNIGTPGIPNWQSIAFSSGWSTTGNTGTDAATNFIGTRDDADLIFKRNNDGAGWIGSSNTSFGILTLSPSSTGSFNTAMGGQTLLYSTSGSFNTGIGFSALTYDSSGSFNTATGSGALFSNRNGSSATAAGYQTLFSNTTGNGNTAYGSQAGFDNITGSSNVFLGYQAGMHETGSNRLYISNSEADANNALIYGEFDNKLLKVNGKLTINVAPRAVGLDIGSAAIQVSGTSPAVFTITATAATTDLVIPNTTMANSSTDILIVTHKLLSHKLNTSPGVYWTGTNWVIFLEDFSNHTVGEQFNVMVIKQ